MQGQTLLQIPIREAKSRLSMDRLDSGLYMVQVMNEKHQLVHRSKLVVL